MDITPQLIGAIGIGALLAKILDVIVLQPRQEEAQHRNWLKDKRLEAFAEAAKEMLSFGLHEGKTRSPFQSYGAVAKALILIDDDPLVKRIDDFLVDIDRMNQLTDSTSKDDNTEGEKLYLTLVDESREIVKVLRRLTLQDRVR